MSATTSTLVYTSRRELLWARLAAYVGLSKPRIASLVLVVVAVSAYCGHWGPPQPWIWIHTLVGTALVAASASTFNQLIEQTRDADAAYRQAAVAVGPSDQFASHFVWRRHAGRRNFRVGAVCELVDRAFGRTDVAVVCRAVYAAKSEDVCEHRGWGRGGGVAGVDWLGSGCASFSFGGGPLPDGIYVAALFLILYLWQFPHFMAIAWIYREQYAAAGMQMLTVVDTSGRRAGAQAAGLVLCRAG